jgi:hypothetical protein
MSDAKKILGSLSPAYGMATGNGLFGQKWAGAGPFIASKIRDDDKEERKKKKIFKAGGKVKGDGRCVQGKTRGKMR